MDPGGYLMALWGLPDAVVQAIAYHRIPASRQERAFAPITAVHVAHALLESRGDPAYAGRGSLDLDYLQEAGCAAHLRNWHQICAARQLEGVLQ